MPGRVHSSLLAHRAASMVLVALCADARTQVAWTRPHLLENRADHALAHDASRDRIVLFGGYSADRALADTWEWDGSAWRLRAPATSPPARGEHGLVYDTARGRVLLFGGRDNQRNWLADTWEWDGNDWRLLAPATSPSARGACALTYDAARGRVVLFGGSDDSGLLGDTWEWDGSTWRLRSPLVSPPARAYHGLAFDAARGVSVLHGGVFQERGFVGVRDDTWEWDGTIWVQRTPANVPPAAWWQVVGHDPQRTTTVLWEVQSGSTWKYAPVQPGRWKDFGNACTGSLGVPQLQPEAGQRPYVGSEFWLRAEPLPGSSAIAAIGFSNTSWFGVLPLPMNLGPFGYPACELAVQTDALVAVPLAGTIARWSIAVPLLDSLVGLEFYVQAFAFDAAGPNGIAATAGGACLVGGL